MKKWLCGFLAVGILCQSAMAVDIWKERTEKTVTKGVQHVREVVFSDAGWQRANILEVDLENENLELTVMKSDRGISTNQTVLQMAKSNQAVAAVNGDFFNWGGSPLGFTVEDGKVISSPSHDPGLAAFIETEDGKVFAEYVDMTLIVTSPEGYTSEILHINKYHPMQSMVLYTSDWGEKTPGSYDGVSELVAVDGIVKEIRQEKEGVRVPENGYVLAVSTKTSGYLIHNFKPGDEIKLSYTLKPDVGKIKSAIGGASVLVKNGRVAEFTNTVSGIHPRTAAGVDKTGKKLFLVTVDGRKQNMPGLSQTALAEYMIAIGCDSAINLDGGGSTTMVTREGETGKLQVVNTPSEGAQRAVSTALGVRFTGEVGALHSLEINIAGGTVTEGGMAHLYLGAYDKNHNPLYIADRKIQYSSNDGTFIGNIFYPSHSGECTILVSCDGVLGKKVINVLAKPAPYAKEKPEDGRSVLILPAKAIGEKDGELQVNKTLEKLADKGDKVYTFGNYNSKKAVKATWHTISTRDDSVFMTLKVGDGGIRKANPAAWQNIVQVCTKTEAKNVFFVLSKPLTDFSDSAEAALFEKLCIENLHGRGKDVFIITPGSTYSETEKNGIRYITVAGRANGKDAKEYGIRFTVKGKKVFFEKVPFSGKEQ